MCLINKLVDKSIEAFITAIEIYNKPTIHYRVEGFSFFICNAWELMLKGYLIKKHGNDSIYYKNNPDRTFRSPTVSSLYLPTIKIHCAKT